MIAGKRSTLWLLFVLYAGIAFDAARPAVAQYAQPNVNALQRLQGDTPEPPLIQRRPCRPCRAWATLPSSDRWLPATSKRRWCRFR